MEKNTEGEIQIPICANFPQIVEGVYRQAEFVEFIIWSSTPKRLRKLKTQKSFGLSVGIDESTLTSWKRHPQFSSFVWQIMKERVRDEIPNIVDNLCWKANSEKVSTKDVDTLLKIADMDFISDKNNK